MLWPVWSMDVNGTVCCAAYRSPNTELWSQPVGGFLGGFELAREHGSFNYIQLWNIASVAGISHGQWSQLGRNPNQGRFKSQNGNLDSRCQILSSNPSNEMDTDICVKIPEPRAIVSFAVKRCMVIIPFREFPNDPNVDLSPTHKVPQS